MGVSPGTGAGIGIACGLMLLFIAGPVAYRHRKKKREQQQQHQGNDLEASNKAQLADTEVSPVSIWRSSEISQWVPEMGTQHNNRGLGIGPGTISRRPISEAAASEIAQTKGSEIAEVDASGQRERVELGEGAQSPNLAELSADLATPPNASPPAEPAVPPQPDTIAQHFARSAPEGFEGDATTPISGLPDVSALPGPILPPPKR